jgi:hypothetical protein
VPGFAHGDAPPRPARKRSSRRMSGSFAA